MFFKDKNPFLFNETLLSREVQLNAIRCIEPSQMANCISNTNSNFTRLSFGPATKIQQLLVDKKKPWIKVKKHRKKFR
jgi:hypothetical protein